MSSPMFVLGWFHGHIPLGTPPNTDPSVPFCCQSHTACFPSARIRPTWDSCSLSSVLDVHSCFWHPVRGHLLKLASEGFTPKAFFFSGQRLAASIHKSMAPMGAYQAHFAERLFPNRAPGSTHYAACAFAELEDAAWDLGAAHCACPLMDQFLPSGDMKAFTKELSHAGAIRRWNPFLARMNTYDPGNWTYGCAGWCMREFVPVHSELRRELAWLNDEHIGDIFEAALGYIFLLQAEGVPVPDLMLKLRDGIERVIKQMEVCLATLPMVGGVIFISQDIVKFLA